MSWRDAHKCSTSTADLSKQLEKGHKRYSSLIYIFPPGNAGAEGHSQRDGVPFVPTAQQLRLLWLPPVPRARPVPLSCAGSMSWRSSGAMSQLCPLAITARLPASPPLPVHQRGRGLFSRKAPTSDTHVKFLVYLLSSPRDRSRWMTVGFSRFLNRAGDIQDNSSSSLGTARTSGLLHALQEGFSPVFGSAQHSAFASGCSTADTGLPVGSTLDTHASL